MDSQKINVSVNSEIGKLQHVLIHTPGTEIENMTPENAHEFLYSDILNLQVVRKEYNYFKKVLQKVAKVHGIGDLLTEVLRDPKIKTSLIDKICRNENTPYLSDFMKDMEVEDLSRQLIEGIQFKDISFIDKEHFSLRPLPNLFFMRDASFTMFDDLMISHMATNVRARECALLESIYNHHPMFDAKVVNPAVKFSTKGIGTIEGGDVHIIREDVILCGLSARTNMEGISALVEHLKTKEGVKHLIFQELPLQPDSFIHLDMVFTMLDVDRCVVYKPVIMNQAFKTFHITIDGHKAVGNEEQDLVSALNGLGIPVEPVFCGGNDPYSFFPAREQWHSGTNFFCFAPGKAIGYGRNFHTIEALSQSGFDIIPAADVVNGKVHPDESKKCIIAFEGNELARGGGGARCMTMPLQRMAVDWG